MIIEPPSPKKDVQSWPKWAVGVFVILSIVLVYVAKWGPYSHKIPAVAHSHTLGPSFITRTQNHPPQPSWRSAWHYGWVYFQSIWVALIAGLMVGTGVETLLPPGWLTQKLGQMGWKSRLFASMAAIPSMMCTCCSSPIVVNLKRQNVSTGAVLSYWIANPILNPATIVFMGLVLGWNWAALRIVLGIILIWVVGILGDRWLPDGVDQRALVGRPPAPLGRHVPNAQIITQFARSFGRLVIRLIPEYIVLVMVLGAARAWLFPAMNPATGHAWWLIVILTLAGTVFVIPTAGEIPVIAVLMQYGLGLSGAGALMLTLPAISLPSAAMVNQVIPAKILTKVGAVVAVFGLLSGVAAHVLF